MALTFTKIVITLRLQRDIRGRYAFFNLKNGFESVFRQNINCCQTSCYGCRSGEECCHPGIFSQSLSADPLALKRYQKPSLPFVFHIPLVPDLPNKGMTVEVEVVLIGSAAEYYQHFIHCVSSVYSGFAALVKAESEDYMGNRYLIMGELGELHHDRLFLFSAEELQNNCQHISGMIEVTFVTPVILLRQGHAMREMSFSTFVRALFRRISSLAYYYGGVEMNCDFKWLVEQSCHVETIESELAWTEWKVATPGARLSGIMGRTAFSGDMDIFYPFLLLGQYFNIGKGASFGRGRYLMHGICR
ncbi:CRISPR system precrRNA processing endoribonuclease RAMP protein Cas6 [Geotalea toluenoxydans]